MGGEEWFLIFSQVAEVDLANLDRPIRRRIIDKLEWLRGNFNTIIQLSLTGHWRGFYKERVGDWRVIYQINWLSRTIIVCYIDHRSQIYKRR